MVCWAKAQKKRINFYPSAKAEGNSCFKFLSIIWQENDLPSPSGGGLKEE
jgi:hypothetical protein